MKEVVNMESDQKNESYQAPVLIEVGSFEELTLGSKYNDTADENSYRW